MNGTASFDVPRQGATRILARTRTPDRTSWRDEAGAPGRSGQGAVQPSATVWRSLPLPVLALKSPPQVSGVPYT